MAGTLEPNDAAIARADKRHLELRIERSSNSLTVLMQNLDHFHKILIHLRLPIPEQTKELEPCKIHLHHSLGLSLFSAAAATPIYRVETTPALVEGFVIAVYTSRGRLVGFRAEHLDS
jgi:hypothetical protein